MPLSRLSQLLFALLFTPACNLIAGLEEHELKPGGGAAGLRWPDSPTAFCSDGAVPIECPTDEQNSLFGQDANYIGHLPTYQSSADGLTVKDSTTGTTWRASPTPMAVTRAEAQSYCDGLSTSGATYRLPTRLELISLLDYGSAKGDINPVAFPEIEVTDKLWASTVFLYKGMKEGYWIIALDCVEEAFCVKGSSDYNGPGVTSHAYEGKDAIRALCVLNEESPQPLGPLEVPESGDVIPDIRTGLTWARDVSNKGLTWIEALAHCRAQAIGGFTDWRLPSVKELQTIVKDDSDDLALFWTPASASGGLGYLWSSTPSHDEPWGAYVLLVTTGTTLIHATDTPYNPALCVRGGLPEQGG